MVQPLASVFWTYLRNRREVDWFFEVGTDRADLFDDQQRAAAHSPVTRKDRLAAGGFGGLTGEILSDNDGMQHLRLPGFLGRLQ